MSKSSAEIIGTWIGNIIYASFMFWFWLGCAMVCGCAVLSTIGFIWLAGVVIWNGVLLFPVASAWLALSVGGIVTACILYDAANKEAAPRVPTIEEKLAADQARFNEWCKSRGL